MNSIKDRQGSERWRWLRRMGWAGFLFFLIKGLIWIAVFRGLGKVVGAG